MPGLFSPKRGAGLLHFLEHILVADVGAQHADAGALQGNLKAHVRHGGGYDCRVRQRSASLHIARCEQQHRIAIDAAAFSVAEQSPVGVNGDAVLLLAARDMQARGTLANATVVATTMSNMGLEIALKRSSIRMLRANVGDKYVLEEMQKTGATLGGEQSGHILFRDGDATTGDGLATALRVMEVMVRSGKPLSELVSDLKVFPQVIKNIRVREKTPFAQVPAIAQAIQEAEHSLNGNGRVVVRYSGTEALARVMVEAESEDTMKALAESIAGAIQTALGT